MRNVGWIQFSLKTNTSKKFVVANTHWSYRTEHAGNKFSDGTAINNDTLRTQCKNETNQLLATLKSRFSSSPIFVTGDFNTSLSVLEGSRWVASGYSLLNRQAETAGVCVTTVPTSGHFDHIWGTGNYSINRFEFFSNVNKKDLVSDHPFVYADVVF